MIDANLDVDVELSRADADRRRARGEVAPSPLHPRFALPSAVLRRIAAWATLMRVHAEPGELLRLPMNIDPARLPSIPDVADVELVGPESPSDEPPRLRWMEPTAWRVADRTFAAALELDAPFPSRIVRSLDELLAFEADEAREWGDRGRWRLKARFSSAGRDQVLGRPNDLRSRRTAERLLALRGPALAEPSVVIEREVGVFVQADGTRRTHEVVPRQGLRTLDEDALPQSVLDAVDVVERALRDAGYAGVFGVDAYEYRGPDGCRRWRTVGEVNPRWTMGGLLHAWVDALRGAGELAHDDAALLWFGRRAEVEGEVRVLVAESTEAAGDGAFLVVSR